MTVDRDELQHIAQLVEANREQMQAIERQIHQLEAIRIEQIQAIEALLAIPEDGVAGAMIPLGSGVQIVADIAADAGAVIDIGSRVQAERTREEAAETLGKRSEELVAIIERMKSENLLHLEDQGDNAGCWVLPIENEDDKIIVRSNGAATYVAKDIPYAAWKLGALTDPFNYAEYTTQPNGRILYETTLEETQVPKQSFAANKVITVIDNRQTNLQKIVTNLMSKFNPESSYVHLGYEAVTLSSETAKILGNKTDGKDVQMSGRKGLYINADEIIEKLEKHIFLESKGRNDDLDDASLNEIAHNVAVGTIRYELIKPDLGKIITFDINTSLKLEGDTCSYIQYSCVRAARILEKFGNEPNFDVQFDQLNTEYETNLIKQIGLFEVFVNDAAKNYSPKVIAKYCYDLAVAFSSFYEHVNVLKADTPELINARVCLVLSFKLTLEKALALLGIIAPQRM